MGRTKKGAIDNAEIENFITNIGEHFEGQRNTLNFMKKLGNVDATEIILHAAEKEVTFVVDRLDALHKMALEQMPLSEETISYIKDFADSLYAQTADDITFKGFDNSKLNDKLTSKYNEFLSKIVITHSI